MMQLAELKLHIRDEYSKNTHAKQRLKRHIAGAPRSESTASALHEAATSTIPLSYSTPTVDEDEREDSASSAGPAEGSLQAITDRLISMSNDDEDNEHESFPSTLSLTLANLFDFSVDYWVKASEATGNRSLQDELDSLDLYELIDLDASGELDTDVDVDGMAEVVLTS
jgi:hypothetical protein